MLRSFVVTSCLIAAPLAALAQDFVQPTTAVAQPNDCVSQAAAYHHQNGWILRAILKVESNFNAKATNRNANGTVDVGIAQINSMHFKELAKYGIAPEHLMDACTSSYVAAWHLAKQVAAYGNTWYAIGAYHSKTPCFNQRYAGLIWNTLIDWRVMNGARVKVRALKDCSGVSAQTKPSPSESTSRTAMLAADFSGDRN